MFAALIPEPPRKLAAQHLRDAATAIEAGDITAAGRGILAGVTVMAQVADDLGKRAGFDLKGKMRSYLQTGIDKVFGGAR